jgi:hypothetical protein
MEKKLAKRKMLRRKYKHYAAAFAGAAIMAGATFHGIPVVRAAAADKPAASSPATTEQMPLNNSDTNAGNSAATPDQRNSSDNNSVTTSDHRDNNNTNNNNQNISNKGDKDHQQNNRYNHDRYKNERWADHGQAFGRRIAWYNDSQNKIQFYNATANPVDIVLAVADDLGFDVNNDTFNLLNQNGPHSIVRAVHNGANYDITIDHLANGNWLVSSVTQSS